MTYKAVHVGDDPIRYFLDPGDEGPILQIADVILRANKDPKEVFAHLIRIATDSKWSHSAIIYLTSNPHLGFNNTFLVEAKTKGVNLVSWRNEVIPSDKFTVGIKRLKLDWYVENAYEKSHHDEEDFEDTHAIGYLRHVRGIAIDQINGLYDRKTVYELSGLYAARAARRHLGTVPQVADAADAVAKLFKKWDESDEDAYSILRFICSGLVQYSFFEALRHRIANDFDKPERREAGLSNLNNLHRVIFRDDPDGLIPSYIQQVRAGKLDIHDPAPDDVLDLLKTATPADFNNSPNLDWYYVILKGTIWRIESAPDGYVPADENEAEILAMLEPEHRSDSR